SSCCPAICRRVRSLPRNASRQTSHASLRLLARLAFPRISRRRKTLPRIRPRPPLPRPSRPLISALCLPCLIQSYAVQQILEARIASDGIEERMEFDPLENIGVFCVSSLSPLKHTIVVSKSQISVQKSASRNVICFAAFF